METNVDFLKKSLLYQMSLGSKELYHSNVWAWLMKNDYAFIKAFISDFDKNIYDVIEVSREYKHRDIIIKLHKKGFAEKQENYFYVIENKIKSLQYEEQLRDYSEDIDGYTMLGGVVTGIRNALQGDTLYLPKKNANSKNIKWKFVSYKDICQSISRISQESLQDIIKEYKPQIMEYCQIIEAIDNVIGDAIDANPNHLNYNCPDKLIELHLNDVFIKLKGSDFMHYALGKKSELEALCPKDKGFKLETWQSFNNGNATLDFKFSNGEMDIGVQIQGEQYRIFVVRKDIHNLQKIYEMYKYCWLDGDFNILGKDRVLFGKYPTTMRGPFNKYGDSFVYQHYTIQQDKYNIIFQNIIDDLKKAKAVIESGLY